MSSTACNKSDVEDDNLKKSSAIAESAEILSENLVIVKKYEPSSNEDVVNSNGDQICVEDSKVSVIIPTNTKNGEADLSINKNENMLLSDKDHHASASSVTIVNTGTQVYTKILPTHVQLIDASILKQKELFSAAQVQDNRTKRLKEDPHLKHLQLHNKIKKESATMKAPLLRSTSMPVCVESDNDLSCIDAENLAEEKSVCLQHRKIFRTGSVSDYTKQRLKTSILMRTSASLVRKPSITDFEMRQIHGDADSSQSDDEDEEDDDREGRFKPVIDDEDKVDESCRTSLLDTSCRTNLLDVSTTSCVVSSLSESNVALVVAMTSA